MIDQDPENVARMEVNRYADEAQPLFKAKHPESRCPSLYALNEFTNKRDVRDPWGTDYRSVCLPDGLPMIVYSAGADRRFGSSDDIRSNDH